MALKDSGIAPKIPSSHAGGFCQFLIDSRDSVRGHRSSCVVMTTTAHLHIILGQKQSMRGHSEPPFLRKKLCKSSLSRSSFHEICAISLSADGRFSGTNIFLEIVHPKASLSVGPPKGSDHVSLRYLDCLIACSSYLSSCTLTERDKCWPDALKPHPRDQSCRLR